MTWHSLECRIDMRSADQLNAIINEMRKGLPSIRHMMFFAKGHKCVTCGLEATHVIAWREKRYADKTGFKGLHVDLIHVAENGRETLMTADHYIPKSKGGPNTVENLNPMCDPCNNKKADEVPEGWVDDRDPRALKKKSEAGKGAGRNKDKDPEALRSHRRRSRRRRSSAGRIIEISGPDGVIELPAEAPSGLFKAGLGRDFFSDQASSDQEEEGEVV